MNKPSLEQELLGTFKRQHQNKAFIAKTMQAVRSAQTRGVFGAVLETAREPKRWWRATRLHRIMAVLAIAVAVSALSVGGYAYAIGTNPVSLIRRWIVGDEVKVQYNGHAYQYGSAKNYSDAAITAYAELQEVGELHFHAQNDFTVTRDSVEYLSPSSFTYVYPWLGTLEKVDDTNLYVRRQHIMEDKMLKQSADGALVPIPKANLWFYVGGKRGPNANVGNQDIGKVIYIAQSPYLQHVQGSRSAPTPLTQYFGYELTHSLAEFEEADQRGGESEKTRGIVEPNAGALSSVCMNNGSDVCDEQKVAGPGGEGLYLPRNADSSITYLPNNGSKQTTIANNANCLPFGEALPDGSTQDDNLVLRSLDGRITAITDKTIIVQTSSGAHWTLAYTRAQQESFAKQRRPLHTGDEIAGSVLSLLTDLDNRSIPDNHIYALKRF